MSQYLNTKKTSRLRTISLTIMLGFNITRSTASKQTHGNLSFSGYYAKLLASIKEQKKHKIYDRCMQV